MSLISFRRRTDSSGSIQHVTAAFGPVIGGVAASSFFC
jgi:hypothetical protein